MADKSAHPELPTPERPFGEQDDEIATAAAAATVAAAGVPVHFEKPLGPFDMDVGDFFVYSSNMMGHHPFYTPDVDVSPPMQFHDGTPALQTVGTALRVSLDSAEEAPGATVVTIPANTPLLPCIVAAVQGKTAHAIQNAKVVQTLLSFDIQHQAAGPGCGRRFCGYRTTEDFTESYNDLLQAVKSDPMCSGIVQKKLGKMTPVLTSVGIDVADEEKVVRAMVSAQVIKAAAQVAAITTVMSHAQLEEEYTSRRHASLRDGQTMYANTLRRVSTHLPGICFFSEVKTAMRTALTTVLGTLGYRRVDPPDPTHVSPSYLFYRKDLFGTVPSMPTDVSVGVVFQAAASAQSMPSEGWGSDIAPPSLARDLTLVPHAGGGGGASGDSGHADPFRSVMTEELNRKSNWCTSLVHLATGSPFQFVGLHLNSNASEAAVVLHAVRSIATVPTAAIGDWNTTRKIKEAMQQAVDWARPDVALVPTFGPGDETVDKIRTCSVQDPKIMLQDLFAKDLAATSGGVVVVDWWRIAEDILRRGVPPPILPNRRWTSDHCGMLFRLRISRP